MFKIIKQDPVKYASSWYGHPFLQDKHLTGLKCLNPEIIKQECLIYVGDEK